jgi:hypothetical protein
MLPAKAKVAKVQNHAALPYEDMPAFWTRLQVQDGLGARALELAILTAGRSGEVLARIMHQRPEVPALAL